MLMGRGCRRRIRLGCEARGSHRRRGSNLSRHGRACPGHPDPKSVALHSIRITGTRPVMTRESWKAHHYVSSLFLTRFLSLAMCVGSPLHRGARSRGVVIVGAGTVLRRWLTQALRQEAHRGSQGRSGLGRSLGRLRCPPKKAVRGGPSGSSHTPHSEPDRPSRPLDCRTLAAHSLARPNLHAVLRLHGPSLPCLAPAGRPC
jgi:hypothetical protein